MFNNENFQPRCRSGAQWSGVGQLELDPVAASVRTIGSVLIKICPKSNLDDYLSKRRLGAITNSRIKVSATR